MRKKKILWSGEASYLCTGYAVYGQNILRRLYETGKYEIAEHSSYGHPHDPRCSSLPWRFYGNLPSNEDEAKTYNQHSPDQFGKWSFNDAVLHFKPDVVCVPPGSMILTEMGYRPIEDIKLGERVLTHKGRLRRVAITMRRQHEGKICRIYYNGCKEPLVLTENHPVLVYRKQPQTNQKKSIGKIYRGLSPEFVPAGELKKSDLIVLPKFQSKDVEITIDVAEYLTQFVEIEGKLQGVRNSSHQINRFIKVDLHFARLIGYIIGDGDTSRGRFGVTFHSTELEFAEDCVHLIRKYFGLEANTDKIPGKDAIRITCCSTLVSKFIDAFVGKPCNRNIPHLFWTVSKEVKEGLISGLIRADGCYKARTVSFTTINQALAHNYRALCLSIDIATSLDGKRFDSEYRSYDVNGYGRYAVNLHNVATKELSVNATIAKKEIRRVQLINGYLVSSINRIRVEEYRGQVYNLEVEEDNSYVVGQACVHNCNIRDTWMWNHCLDSPLRDYYNLAVMTACDAECQNEDWLYLFQQVDGLFTYTDWAKEEITNQTNGVITPIRSLAPGADFEVFRPVPNKAAHKQRFGFSPDIFIVGMLSRNQKRKLFPDLFSSFRDFLNKTADSTIGRKTFLYLHTSWPDVGWDIPFLLKQYGLSHKVLFTYFCKNCKLIFPCFFQDNKGVCPKCGDCNCRMPDTQVGLNPDALAGIYNLFDLYVQYSNSEGFGIGLAEAAACGVPVCAVDYSAMKDIVRNLRGYAIETIHKTKEAETGCLRAAPNNKQLVDVLVKFLSLPEQIRLKKGWETRNLCIQHYNYDKAAQGWEEYFDAAPHATWDNPPRFHQPITTVPDGLTSEDLVTWGIINVLGLPNKLHSYFHMKLLRDLNTGKAVEGFGGPHLQDMSYFGMAQRLRDFSAQDMLQFLYNLRMDINLWEQRRCGLTPYTPPICISQCKHDANPN